MGEKRYRLFFYMIIYCVAGRKSDGTYACWTSWSEATQSLNHGHYGLKSFDLAEKILKENFVDITGDAEAYGLAKTRAEIGNQERDVDMGRQPRGQRRKAGMIRFSLSVGGVQGVDAGNI